jgi:hypothetical protein
MEGFTMFAFTLYITDYLCLGGALTCLASLPVIILWPERKENYGVKPSQRETAIHTQETRKE